MAGRKKGPMTIAEAEKKNPGGGNLIEAAKRKEAEHQAYIADIVYQLGIADCLPEIQKLEMADKKALMLQMNFAGLSLNDCSKLLDINIKTAMRWFQDNPEEMQRLVKAQLSVESLKEVGPTFARLKSLRFNGNAETSRKASLDVLAVAGMSPHGVSGVNVTVNTPNAQFNLMPIAELEAKLREVAKFVGPTAEKIVDAEVLAVKDMHGRGNRKSEDAGTGAGPDSGPADGAPA